MKAPEEYLAQQGGFFPNDNTSRAYFEQEALAALKSMQEDHEKELIEFAEWVSDKKISEYKHNKFWEGSNQVVNLESTAELLTQFRKG